VKFGEAGEQTCQKSTKFQHRPMSSSRLSPARMSHIWRSQYTLVATGSMTCRFEESNLGPIADRPSACSEQGWIRAYAEHGDFRINTKSADDHPYIKTAFSNPFNKSLVVDRQRLFKSPQPGTQVFKWIRRPFNHYGVAKYQSDV